MLVIEGVSKVYPTGAQALSGVTLTLERGVFGLLGPNGAGKSTLMKILVGILRPDSGRILFDGLDVARETKRVRQRLGYLPQDFGLYPDATAEGLLEHLATLKGIRSSAHRKMEVDRLLEATNLTYVRKQKLATFSGGMRQRFGIAQALIGSPDLVIVDEPTVGLDPEERHRLLNVLATFRRDAVVLLSTHIVQDVAELCPRMALLKDGQIAASESPAAALDSMRGRVVRTSIEPEHLTAFQQEHQVLSSRFVGGHLVVHFLTGSVAVAHEVTEPTLEDYYFSHIRGFRADMPRADTHVV